MGLWSFMTVLCGMATGFVSLFLARIGEAGGLPPSASLVSDYFKPERRARIFSILASAVPLGVFVGFLLGGWVAEFYGWRAAFIVAGAPGILVAFVLWLTLREPPRGFSDNRRAEPAPPFRETLQYLAGLKSCRQTFSGCDDPAFSRGQRRIGRREIRYIGCRARCVAGY
jgi:MFS family permease